MAPTGRYMMPYENQLSDRQKRYVMMMADALILVVALWASVALRYGDVYQDVLGFWWLFPVCAVLGVAAFRKLGLYRAIVRYIGDPGRDHRIGGCKPAGVFYRNARVSKISPDDFLVCGHHADWRWASYRTGVLLRPL